MFNRIYGMYMIWLKEETSASHSYQPWEPSAHDVSTQESQTYHGSVPDLHFCYGMKSASSVCRKSSHHLLLPLNTVSRELLFQ